jgi:hypothetical protein
MSRFWPFPTALILRVVERFYSNSDFAARSETAGLSGEERATRMLEEGEQDMQKIQWHLEQWLKSGRPVRFSHGQISSLDWW